MGLAISARILIFFFAAVVWAGPAAKKTTATAKGENQDLILTATLYLEPTDIKDLLDGADLGANYILIDVKIEPKYGKEIAIDRDDFQLRTDKDGEKSKPFAASQIAGSGALIITQKSSSEGVQSPGWTGMGGPVILGGGGRGAAAGRGSEVDATASKASQQNADGKENPLKKLLESKILQEKKTADPVSGLLYFVMGKQKMKDLELMFGGRENRISLRFKP